MNKKELEKINKKLDMIFNMLMEVKQNNDFEKIDKDIKDKEEEVKRANEAVQWRTDDRRWLYEKYDNIRKCWRDIDTVEEEEF